MANTVITKTGNIVKTVYNETDSDYYNGAMEELQKNVTTGFWVAKMANGEVHTNLLCVTRNAWTVAEVDSVAAVTTDTQLKLYDELAKLL